MITGSFDHEALNRQSPGGRAPGAAVANTLAPLSSAGYHILPDRGWPDDRLARVDVVAVGPGGLFIVDTTSWRDISIVDGRVYREGRDVTGELASLADLAYLTEAAMADLGLAPGEVHAVVVVAGDSSIRARIGTIELVAESHAVRYLLGHGQRLTVAQVALVVRACLEFFPTPGGQHSVFAPGVATALLPSAAFASPELAMAFLDPEQARLARRSFNGPSRIRGAVGTGKTVVALHRAAYLARTQPGIVLVTSFVSTLPAVLAARLRRMAPDIAGRVEFLGTHAFAKRLLSDRGIRCNLQPAIADAEFDVVWRTIGRRGILGRLDATSTYWDDEIEHVIKGRGISTFEEYAALPRTGRRHPLGTEQRRAVWELFLAYQERMRARGAHDPADLILMAEQSLRETPLRRYAAVIVDEAQDLSAMMIRMLHRLVGDRPDGLTLVGDGRQAIYPGGYTLAEAGVTLVGRGIALRPNYRNTGEIVDFAGSVVAADDGIDLDGPAETGSPASTPRRGSPPLVVRFTNRAAHDAELPRRIREIVAAGGTHLGDIGILSLTTFGVRAAVAALQKSNIPVVELTRYDGHPVDAVKVGTVKRAKGLEFSHVLVVHVPSALMPGHDAAPVREGHAAAERTMLQKRELFVAMTRARNELWIGTVP